MRPLVKQALHIALAGITFTFGPTYAGEGHRYPEMLRAQALVDEAVRLMARARAAQHYDRDGHGAKAEDLLQQAARELQASIELSSKKTDYLRR